MTVKELFDFVTDPTVDETNMDDYLEKSMEIASTRGVLTGNDKTEDQVGPTFPIFPIFHPSAFICLFKSQFISIQFLV